MEKQCGFQCVGDYLIEYKEKLFCNDYIAKVYNPDRISSKKHLHFRILESGATEIIREMEMNRFEVFCNGIVKFNRGIGEENEEVLYDSKKAEFILFPFTSITLPKSGDARGIRNIKRENESFDLIMHINENGKICTPAICTFDFEYYDISPDGSNIYEIIEIINKKAKKDSALVRSRE